MPVTRQRAFPIDLWSDERLMMQSTELKWTAAGLRMTADDAGRGSANPSMLKAGIWPLQPEITEEILIDHLLKLDALNYVIVYADGPLTWYAMTEWPSVSHATPSRIPEPPKGRQRSSGESPETFAARERVRDESASGREWVSEPGDVWEPESAAADQPEGFPPDPFCPGHPRGTFANCRHCGTARLLHEKWLRAQRSAGGGDA